MTPLTIKLLQADVKIDLLTILVRLSMDCEDIGVSTRINGELVYLRLEQGKYCVQHVLDVTELNSDNVEILGEIFTELTEKLKRARQ